MSSMTVARTARANEEQDPLFLDRLPVDYYHRFCAAGAGICAGLLMIAWYLVSPPNPSVTLPTWPLPVLSAVLVAIGLLGIRRTLLLRPMAIFREHVRPYGFEPTVPLDNVTKIEIPESGGCFFLHYPRDIEVIGMIDGERAAKVLQEAFPDKVDVSVGRFINSKGAKRARRFW